MNELMFWMWKMSLAGAIIYIYVDRLRGNENIPMQVGCIAWAIFSTIEILRLLIGK